jgi:transcriptional regulator with XRE-family HTH domain
MDFKDFTLKNDKVGRRIRTEREALGISRDELADMVGMESSSLKNVEYGEKGVSVAVLARISLSLDLPVDYLIFGTKTAGNIDDTDVEKRNIIESTVRLMENLDSDQCARIEAIVRMILSAMKKTE